MNKKRSQQIFNALNKTSRNSFQNKKFSFSYKSDFLEYKSHLSNFSSEQYTLFDKLFSELAVQDSIQSLFSGEIVNTTEGRSALHHKYRALKPSPEFDFQIHLSLKRILIWHKKDKMVNSKCSQRTR